jgi:hypothetical protein
MTFEFRPSRTGDIFHRFLPIWSQVCPLSYSWTKYSSIVVISINSIPSQSASNRCMWTFGSQYNAHSKRITAWCRERWAQTVDSRGRFDRLLSKQDIEARTNSANSEFMHVLYALIPRTWKDFSEPKNRTHGINGGTLGCNSRNYALSCDCGEEIPINLDWISESVTFEMQFYIGLVPIEEEQDVKKNHQSRK